MWTKAIARISLLAFCVGGNGVVLTALCDAAGGEQETRPQQSDSIKPSGVVQNRAKETATQTKSAIGEDCYQEVMRLMNGPWTLEETAQYKRVWDSRTERRKLQREIAVANLEQFSIDDMISASRVASRKLSREAWRILQIREDLNLVYSAVGGGIQNCYWYYPEKAKGDAGIKPLLGVIKDRTDDPLVRRFLISSISIHGIPGAPIPQWDDVPGPLSFSDYLSMYAARRSPEVRKTLRLIAKDPLEDPYVRMVAMWPNRNWLTFRVRHALRNDSKVKAYIKRHSPQITKAKERQSLQVLPPKFDSSRVAPTPLYADKVVREGKVKAAKETAERLSRIHAEMWKDILDLETILTSPHDVPEPVKSSILSCAYYYREAAVDNHLRKKLQDFRVRYGVEISPEEGEHDK